MGRASWIDWEKKSRNTKKTRDADKVINQLGHQSVQPTAAAAEAAAAAATLTSTPTAAEQRPRQRRRQRAIAGDHRDLRWSDFDSKPRNATYMCPSTSLPTEKKIPKKATAIPAFICRKNHSADKEPSDFDVVKKRIQFMTDKGAYRGITGTSSIFRL